jgi:hypothetical protein
MIMKIIVASYIFLPNIALAAVAEAMAMRVGLALANHNGCNNFAHPSLYRRRCIVG